MKDFKLLVCQWAFTLKCCKSPCLIRCYDTEEGRRILTVADASFRQYCPVRQSLRNQLPPAFTPDIPKKHEERSDWHNFNVMNVICWEKRKRNLCEKECRLVFPDTGNNKGLFRAILQDMRSDCPVKENNKLPRFILTQRGE